MSRTMHEPPARFINQIADTVTEIDRESMECHVESMHIPPKRRDPLTAIPFAGIRLDDVTVAKAIEMLRTMQYGSVELVAQDLDVPVEALELALAEYKPRWKRFLFERAC